MKNFVDLCVFDLGLSGKFIFIIFRQAGKLIGRLRPYNLAFIMTLTV